MLMPFLGHRILAKTRNILGFVAGGVHKRIDENRELLELIRRDAPAFLDANPWVERWLRSHDEFFVELVATIPIAEGRFLGQAKRNPERFPRPWPSSEAVLGREGGSEEMRSDSTTLDCSCTLLSTVTRQRGDVRLQIEGLGRGASRRRLRLSIQRPLDVDDMIEGSATWYEHGNAALRLEELDDLIAKLQEARNFLIR